MSKGGTTSTTMDRERGPGRPGEARAAGARSGNAILITFFISFPFDFLQMQFHRKEVSAQCNPSASLNTVNIHYTAADEMKENEAML